MLEYIRSRIAEIARVARDRYGVDPVIFVAIYLLCAPIFYYSLYRTLRALARKGGKEVMIWSAVFLGSVVAPFVYVLIFGRNIPWWVYGIIAILVGQGVLSLVMKLRSAQRPGDDTA